MPVKPRCEDVGHAWTDPARWPASKDVVLVTVRCPRCDAIAVVVDRTPARPAQ